MASACARTEDFSMELCDSNGNGFHGTVGILLVAVTDFAHENSFVECQNASVVRLRALVPWSVVRIDPRLNFHLE